MIEPDGDLCLYVRRVFLDLLAMSLRWTNMQVQGLVEGLSQPVRRSDRDCRTACESGDARAVCRRSCLLELGAQALCGAGLSPSSGKRLRVFSLGLIYGVASLLVVVVMALWVIFDTGLGDMEVVLLELLEGAWG